MKKVAWYAGLPISQQHFQMQDSLSELEQNFRLQLSSHNAFGLKSLEIDTAQLEQGVILVTSCEAILADGTLIAIPKIDADKLMLQADPSMSDCLVYLAIPYATQSGKYVANSRFEASQERFYIDEEVVYDAVIGADDVATLQVLKPNIRLVVNTENYQDHSLLPLMKIKSVNANRSVVLDMDYIPPLLDISASTRLSLLLKEIYTLSQQRRKQLLGRLSNIDEYGTAGLIEMLLLQLVNRYQPILAHFNHQGRITPEVMYRVLLSLSSELRTFTSDEKGYNHPPVYIHTDLAKTFDPLADDLRQAFAHIFEERAKRIALTYYEKYALYVATLGDLQVNEDDWTFVIACKTETPKEQLSLTLPKIIKVASKEQITNVVSKQLPGIRVVPMVSAPKQIPFMSDYVYFELDKKSEFWKSIYEMQTLSLCLTRRFAQIDLQLWAIKR